MSHRPNLYLDVASHGLLRRATDNGWGLQPRSRPWTAIVIYSAAIVLAAMLLWGG